MSTAARCEIALIRRLRLRLPFFILSAAANSRTTSCGIFIFRAKVGSCAAARMVRACRADREGNLSGGPAPDCPEEPRRSCPERTAPKLTPADRLTAECGTCHTLVRGAGGIVSAHQPVPANTSPRQPPHIETHEQLKEPVRTLHIRILVLLRAPQGQTAQFDCQVAQHSTRLPHTPLSGYPHGSVWVASTTTPTSWTGAQIIDALERSGLGKPSRADATLQDYIDKQFVTKSGTRRGTKYRLTPPGLTKAKEITKDLLKMVG